MCIVIKQGGDIFESAVFMFELAVIPSRLVLHLKVRVCMERPSMEKLR